MNQIYGKVWLNKNFLIIFNIRYFENLACDVLNKFDETSDDLANGVLMLQKIPYYKLNCLEMAFEGNLF